ncbi:MAG TPA: ISNCY family transposase [Roseiarcus sp.]|nr:ISNCY family transposase [Roseiarcus sp.]
MERRRAQRSFGDGLIADEVKDLREGWMNHADRLLDDEAIVAAVYEALGRRHPKSRSRGRLGAPADVVLRLLVLKHVRNWSYEVLEREVRANLVYRDFTRVGGGKMPDAKTIGRWGLAVGPETVKQVHERLVQMAQAEGIATGRRMRVDTTVVETNVHYPTDSSLLGDGVRVLTRAMKKITAIVGDVGANLRDRSRSVKLRVLDIARAARAKGPQSQERLKRGYGRLLSSTSRVVGQAKRFAREIADGIKWTSGIVEQLALKGLRQQIEEMAPRVRQVMKQTRARLFGGDTHVEGKLLSLFEPSTEIIRKGKAAKPNEFGKMVKLQEAENQIVVDYEVYDRRPNDADLLIPAIETHQARLGRAPYLVAADAAFYSGKNEAAAKAKGVKRVCVPNRSTKSSERKREQKKRWFRNGQKWRTGSEGRISVVKRRHGLDRCRYKGDSGMRRWVGLGVIGDNLVTLGNALAKTPAR